MAKRSENNWPGPDCRGFRHKTVKVPEWRNVSVVLREPSAEGLVICGRKCSMVMERMTIPCRWWRKPAVTWSGCDAVLRCPVDTESAAGVSLRTTLSRCWPLWSGTCPVAASGTGTLIADAESAEKVAPPGNSLSDATCAPSGAHLIRTAAQPECERGDDVDGVRQGIPAG